MKTKKLLSVILALCMLLSVIPMTGITASAAVDPFQELRAAETDPYASQGYVAYVVPHTLNADGTVADTERPTEGTFEAYLYDATGETVVNSATSVSYDGLEITEDGETRYYYKSVDAAMAAAQAGETNTGYATSSNTNGVIKEGTKDGTYAGNDYLNPDLGKYTDTVVLLGDVDGYLYNYVRNQTQLSDWLVDGVVSAEEYSDLADTQKYGIHKGIIVDLNGHTVGGISGGIIPKNETLIIKNGTVSGSGTNIVGNSAYDDENFTGELTGNVVFSGITLSGNIFSGKHGFIFLDGQYNPNFSYSEIATGIYLYSGYYVNDPADMGANIDFFNYHVQAKAYADDAEDWPEGYNYRILNGASSYNIKLDTNGVDNTVLKGGEAYTGETLTKTFKTSITLPTDLTVQGREDVTFLGWSRDKYADSASYTDTLSADIARSGGETATLYAIWSGPTVTGITLDPTEKTVNLSTDSLTFDITATVTPSDAYNQDIVYSSSDEKVATVDENGKVTVINRGTAIITATADSDKNVCAICTVTVNHDKHTWSYTAKGDILTAVCGVTGCDYSGNSSLKISWNGTSAVLNGDDGQVATELAGQDSLPTIYYEGTSGTEYESSTVAPTADGSYMATATVENATALCDYTIGESESYLCPVYKSTTGSFYENAAAGIEDEWRTAYCQDPAVINSGTTQLTAGWYIVRGKISTSAITVLGEVNIILEDGCELTVNGGINVEVDYSLTIYAQSTGNNMGKLIATGGEGAAGIGGGGKYCDENADGFPIDSSNGPITINGGNVTATGGETEYSDGGGAGIGGDVGTPGSNIVINGGIVAATGNIGAGIGGGGGCINGDYTTGSNIVVNGGTVTATGDGGGAGIGGGCFNYNTGGNNIVVNGGTVTATGSENEYNEGSSGIGGGAGGGYSKIEINGGTVNATGGTNGSGIGSTYITISGGTVTATGIVGGNGIDGGYITISGGTVTGTGGEGYVNEDYPEFKIGTVGIGGHMVYELTITGGTVTAIGHDGGAGIGCTGSYFGIVEKITIGADDLSNFVKIIAIAEGGFNAEEPENSASAIGCGYASAYLNEKVYVNAMLLTKADSSSNPPTTVIENNGGDLSKSLRGKTYALIDRGLVDLAVSGTTVADKEYDGTTDAVATVGTVTGIAEGDEVEVIATAEFASANATTQEVTVSYTLSGKDADKYNAPASETLFATITQKYLIIEVGNIEGYVGDALAKDEAFTLTADGLAEGDTVTPTFDKSNIITDTVGAYDICLGSYEIKDASDNDVKDNYCIICLNGTYNVYATETEEIVYSASLTLNKNIDINLKMKNFGNDCNPTKIGVTVDGEEVDVKYDSENKILSCVLKAIEPKDIGTKLSVTVTYDGKLAKVFTYSAADYCNAVFKANTSDKYADLAALCEAVLNYGKYAQDYYYEQKYGEGIFTSTLNDGHEATFGSNYEFDGLKAAKVTIDECAGAGSAAYLTLDSTIKLNFILKNSTVNLENDDAETQNFFVLNEKNEQIDPERVEITTDGDDTLVSIDLYASQLSTSYTLKLKGVDTSKFCITYGVYNYCSDAQSQTGALFTDTVKILCKAIHNYSVAVDDYIESTENAK